MGFEISQGGPPAGANQKRGGLTSESPLEMTTRPADESIAHTPGPAPPMRARSDDQEPQPSPKKLKSAVQEKAPRRFALRDLTNDLGLDPSGGSQGTAKRPPQVAKSAPKPRASPAADPRAAGIVAPSLEEAVVLVDTTTIEEPQPDASPFGARLQTVSFEPRLSEELLAFDPLVGREEEDELADIMFTQLRNKQMQNRVTTDYFLNQPHINAKMRSILVDWLIDVHRRFQLQSQTLFLAVNYLDRYLEQVVTTRSELQLVGLTCLIIAAKFEEVEPIDLADAVFVSDKAYDAEQIIVMERRILGAMRFNLAAVSAHNFLEYFARKLNADSTQSFLAEFITQNALLHLPLLACYPPAERAASAFFLARCMFAGGLPEEEWVKHWETSVSCTFTDLQPCFEDLSAIMAHQSRKLLALRNKYSTKRFGRVALQPLDGLNEFL